VVAELTNRKLRRSAHRSVTDWKPTSASGSTPGTKTRPYVWTKTADEILDTRAAYCRRRVYPTNGSGALSVVTFR
jgi:hypothetical protein